MEQEVRSAVDVRVTGRVQGVWYRNSSREQAQRLQVYGWVRNENDGSVAAHLEGAPNAVQELLTWCETGPAAARVARVEVTPANDEGYRSFEIT